MATIAEALQIALQHHQAGRLQEAEALYRQILQAQPEHADALHLLGVIAHQIGKHDLAIRYIEQAIARNPQDAKFHNNIGEAYRALREEPPAGAHSKNVLDAAVTWWRGLSAAERKRYNALMGFSFNPKDSGL